MKLLTKIIETQIKQRLAKEPVNLKQKALEEITLVGKDSLPNCSTLVAKYPDYLAIDFIFEFSDKATIRISVNQNRIKTKREIRKLARSVASIARKLRSKVIG